jgi:ubiquitin-protein ligase
MPNPKERRLLVEHEKVKKLVAESGETLALVKTLKEPPTTYVIEFRCPGLVKGADGQPALAERHQVEINLGSNYPFEMPTARVLTPVFNPHVFSSNAVCLGGVWTANDTLDTLILRIGALLQLDPRVLNPHSPANSEANLWAQKNKAKLPLGRVTFKGPAEPEKKIQWG